MGRAHFLKKINIFKNKRYHVIKAHEMVPRSDHPCHHKLQSQVTKQSKFSFARKYLCLATTKKSQASCQIQAHQPVRESPKRPSFRKKYQGSISMQHEAILVISSPSLPTTNNLRTRKIMTAAASSSTTYRFCNCCAPSNYLMKRVTQVAPVTHLLVGFQDLATVRDIWSRQNLFSAS